MLINSILSFVSKNDVRMRFLCHVIVTTTVVQ